MRRLRLPILLLLLAGLGAHSAAQAPPAPSPPAPPTAASEPTESGSVTEELPEFRPSEHVSADVAVPFPVDI